MTVAALGLGLMCVGLGAFLGASEGRYSAPAGVIAAILGLIIAVVGRTNGAVL